MGNILVTGATGRVGRHLVEALVNRGEEVRILARNPAEIQRAEVFRADLFDITLLREAVVGVDVIYHLAANVDYLASKDELFRDNVVGTKNLLDVSQNRRFIFLSSTAAMGKKLEKIPADETTPCKPSDFYGRTKLEAENLVRKKGGIVIRSADIAGPGFMEGYDYVISRMVQGRLKIPGKGTNLIQWVHVADLVAGLLLAKENGELGEVYILTGKEARTLNECLALLAKYLNVEPPRKHIPKTFAIAAANYQTWKMKRRKQEPRPFKEYIEKMTANRSFNITKAKTQLGYQPIITYEEIAKQTLNEYKKQQCR